MIPFEVQKWLPRAIDAEMGLRRDQRDWLAHSCVCPVFLGGQFANTGLLVAIIAATCSFFNILLRKISILFRGGIVKLCRTGSQIPFPVITACKPIGNCFEMDK